MIDYWGYGNSIGRFLIEVIVYEDVLIVWNYLI